MTRGDDLGRRGTTARAVLVVVGVFAFVALLGVGAWVLPFLRSPPTVQGPGDPVYARLDAPGGGAIVAVPRRGLVHDGAELRRLEPDGHIVWRAAARSIFEPFYVDDARVIARVQDDEGPPRVRAWAIEDGTLAWEADDLWSPTYPRLTWAVVAGEVLELVPDGQEWNEAGGTLLRMRSLATGEVLFDVAGPAHGVAEHLVPRVWHGRLFVDGAVRIDEIDLATGALSSIVSAGLAASCVTSGEIVTLTHDGELRVQPESGPVLVLGRARAGRLACGRDGARLYVSWGADTGAVATPSELTTLGTAEPLAVPETAAGALLAVEGGRVVASLLASWGRPSMHFEPPRDGAPAWSPPRDAAGNLSVHVLSDPRFIGEEAGFDPGTDLPLTLDPTTLAVVSRAAEREWLEGAPEP